MRRKRGGVVRAQRTGLGSVLAFKNDRNPKSKMITINIIKYVPV